MLVILEKKIFMIEYVMNWDGLIGRSGIICKYFGVWIMLVIKNCFWWVSILWLFLERIRNLCMM